MAYRILGPNYSVPDLNQAAQTLGGDLSGTTANASVISLTGSSGSIPIASTGNILTWDAATTSPGLLQTTTTTANGQTTTIHAQACARTDGVAGTGGTLSLAAGSCNGVNAGNNSGGSIYLNVGTASNSSGTNTSGNINFCEGANVAIAMVPKSSGTSTMNVQSGVAAFTFQHNTTSTANGGPFIINAQNTTRTDGVAGTGGSASLKGGGATGVNAAANTGGAVILDVGTASGGTSNTNGSLLVRAGGTNALTWIVNPTSSNTLTFTSTITSLTLNQSQTTAAANGAAWTLQAQTCVRTDGSAGSGGNLVLAAGQCNGVNAGNNTGGNVYFNAGTASNSSSTNTSGNIYFREGSNAVIAVSPRFQGSTTVNVQPSVSGFTIQQNTTTASELRAGATFGIKAQSSGNDGYSGGVFTINAGNTSGTSAANGGTITLTGGNSDSVTGTTNAGDISLIGGSATGSTAFNSRGGNINITGGDVKATVTGGGARYGGVGNVAGGVNITGGNAIGTANIANGGIINIKGGTGASTGFGGDINIIAGSGSGYGDINFCMGDTLTRVLQMQSNIVNCYAQNLQFDGNTSNPIFTQSYLYCTTGYTMNIRAQDMFTTTGLGTNVTCVGGALIVSGGNATGNASGVTNTNTGGNLTVKGGDASGATGLDLGGDVTLQGGSGETGGNVFIASGAGTNTNGSITLQIGATPKFSLSSTLITNAIQQNDFTVDAKGTARQKSPVNVQTTDATVTTLDSFTLASNTSVVYEVIVTAVKSDNTQAAAYVRRAAFRNNAGTVTQVSATQDGGTFEDDATWDCTIDNSTTTIRVRVTGKASTTIRWTSFTRRLEVIA